jgi:hypothetical protein
MLVPSEYLEDIFCGMLAGILIFGVSCSAGEIQKGKCKEDD